MLIGKIIMLEELSKCNADLSDILMTSLWDTYCCDTHVLVWWAFSVCVRMWVSIRTESLAPGKVSSLTMDLDRPGSLQAV